MLCSLPQARAIELAQIALLPTCIRDGHKLIKASKPSATVPGIETITILAKSLCQVPSIKSYLLDAEDDTGGDDTGARCAAAGDPSMRGAAGGAADGMSGASEGAAAHDDGTSSESDSEDDAERGEGIANRIKAIVDERERGRVKLYRVRYRGSGEEDDAWVAESILSERLLGSWREKAASS